MITRLVLALGLLGLYSLCAGAEADTGKAEKLVAKGGAQWSAPDKLEVSGGEVTPGARLLFWPVDDEVHEVVDNHATIRFHWALPANQPPFKNRQGLSLAVHSATDPEFKSSTIVQLPAQERDGIFEARLPVAKLDVKGQTELVLHLRLEEPQSNLLRIKTRFGGQARVPRIIR